MLLDEFGLEVEEINVRRSAGHEELHDALGLRLVMQSAVGEQSIVAKHGRQGDTAQAAARMEEEVTTREHVLLR
jgi:hypothetical protein